MPNRQVHDVIAELQRISGQPSEKTVTMHIMPMDENWSYELHFSDEERDSDETHDLIAELGDLMRFRVTTPTFPYAAK